MTKMIELTQGKKALVDDELYDELNQHKWYAHQHGRTYYARRNSPRVNGKQTTIRMHRVILGIEVDVYSGIDIDHINRNGLDNRKSNLRLVSHVVNSRNNRVSKHNTSGYTGVTWHAAQCKWQVQIIVNYKTIYLGLYTNIDDAIQARADGEEEYWK